MSPTFPGFHFLVTAIFVVFIALTVGGALVAALTTRIIRSVCGLAICSVGLAGLYYYLRSPFLALMEILIYIGAVCVTIVFAVMLAEPDEPVTKKENLRYRSLWTAFGVAVSGFVFWSMVRLCVRTSWPAPAERVSDGSVPVLGNSLLTTYSLAFELISLVLLVAILGALLIARTGRHQT
jgi:NADH:ubiquinone oxidoreductase subunit 6 (subunit J)